MKKILMTLIAALAIGVAHADGIDDLLSKRSDDCPISITEGMSVVSAVPGPSELVFTYAIDTDKVNFADLKDQKDLLHDVMATDIATTKNADTRRLASYCQANGVNIVLRFTDGATAFDIVVTPDDLKF